MPYTGKSTVHYYHLRIFVDLFRIARKDLPKRVMFVRVCVRLTYTVYIHKESRDDKCISSIVIIL